MDERVTNIEFRIDGRLMFRYVLENHRKAMKKIEKRMRAAGCEPVLVVDSDNAYVRWCDDICFITDSITKKMVHRPEEDAFFKASVNLTFGSSLRARFDGRVIEAYASNAPLNEEDGCCTNDCEPADIN